MSEKKALALIGLAEKAGKVASGEFSTEKMLKAKRACLVVLSSDASENTKKKFRDKCGSYGTPILELCDKNGLGHAIGKQDRSCLAVLDAGLAAGIQKELTETLPAEEPMEK